MLTASWGGDRESGRGGTFDADGLLWVSGTQGTSVLRRGCGEEKAGSCVLVFCDPKRWPLRGMCRDGVLPGGGGLRMPGVKEARIKD